MKLSMASSYALHALEHLAAQEGKGSDAPVPSHVIAKAHGIPERFMLKVLKPLVAAHLLRSMKGPHGGFRLARPAAKITVLEVVEAVDGEIRGEAPLAQEEGRPDGLDGRLDAVCGQAAETVRKHLAKVKLSDLIGAAV